MSIYEKEFIVDGKFRRKIIKYEDGTVKIVDVGEVSFADKKRLDIVKTVQLSTESTVTSDKPNKYQENIVNDAKNLALNFGVIGIGTAGINIVKEFIERGYNRVFLYGKDKTTDFSDEKYTDSILDEFGKVFGITLDCAIISFGCGQFAVSCYESLFNIVKQYFSRINKDCRVIFIVSNPVFRESKVLRESYKKAASYAQVNQISFISIDNDLFIKKHPKYLLSKTLGIANRTIVGLFAAFNDYSNRKSIYKGLSRGTFESVIKSPRIIFGATGIESLSNVDKIKEIAEKNVKSLHVNVTFKANTRVSVVLLVPKSQMVGAYEKDYEKTFDLVVKSISEVIVPFPSEISSAVYEQDGIEASYIYTMISGSY